MANWVKEEEKGRWGKGGGEDKTYSEHMQLKLNRRRYI